jgi:hypothetical protein
MIRHQPHLPPLGQSRNQKNSLHPREAFADTTPRATAKRKIGKLRSSLPRCRDPTIGIKS